MRCMQDGQCQHSENMISDTSEYFITKVLPLSNTSEKPFQF